VDGSARVRIGQTVVLAGIQCEATHPTDTEPARGRIIVSLELAGVCSPVAGAAVARGGPGGAGRLEREQAALLELLQRTASGGLVDLDALCAVEGRAVWTCHCDLYVLEHDGNLTDAALLAMSAALSNLKLPHVWYDEKLDSLVVEEPVPTLASEASGKRKRSLSQPVPGRAEALRTIKLSRPLLPSTFAVLSGQLLMVPLLTAPSTQKNPSRPTQP